MPGPGSNPPPDGNGVKPFIWALIPYRIEGARLTAETYESERTKAELAATFHELGLPWVWQPVVLTAVEDLSAQITASMTRRPTVVFNLCDGVDEVGTPGVSVVKALERAGIPFTGASSRFYEISTSKVRMKTLFRERGVPTAPWEVLPRTGPVQGVCERMGAPLFVKPDVSSASEGISLKSKVLTDAAIEARRDELRQGELREPFANQDIFVERYLAGDEYTIFVGGFWDRPDELWTLPPARRCFADSIPHDERFLSFDRYWGYYKEEIAPAEGEPFYRYALVEGPRREELTALAKRAYCAVDGHGYARVDIRSDTIDGTLSVLEVNANCGLSGDDQTSTGSILQLMSWTLSGLIARLIAQTLERNCA